MLDGDAARARAGGRRARGRDALCGAAARRRICARAARRTTGRNVTGTLSVLAAMADAGVQALRLLVDVRDLRRAGRLPIDETHPQRPINAYGETKLAIERALPHVERASGIRWIALRYFNAAGADADGLIGEAHHPKST